MNRFTAFAVCPHAENVRELVALVRSGLTVTPAEGAARSRKLRLAVGSFSICARVTLVATSDGCAWTLGAAVTATVDRTVACEASVKSWTLVAPICTTTRRVIGE